MVRRRIRLAQNFLRERRVAASVVAASGLDRGDVVYEIGPGEGMLTGELARRCGRVVAVEKDPALAALLRRRFRDAGNVRVVEGDWLRYRVREPGYRLFGNIPFNITARVVKAVLFGRHPPREARLVVQREAAERFTGFPRQTEVAVLARPWFAIQTARRFRRTDFEPAPGVDVVLLLIARRPHPLVARAQAGAYRRFVRFGFEAWRRDLKTAFRRVFTHEQWKRLSQSLGFPPRARPTELTFGQWLGLFEFRQRPGQDAGHSRPLPSRRAQINRDTSHFPRRLTRPA